MLNKIKLKLDTGTLELLKHAKNYISAEVLVKGISIIRMPIMTRLLTPSDYGILGVFSSFVAIISIFYGLGFRGAVARYYYEENNDFGSFIFSNTVFLWLWGIFLFIVLLWNRILIAQWLNLPVNLIIFGSTTAFIATTYSLLYAYLQASKQSKIISKISINRSIASFFVSITIIYFLKENRYLGSVYSGLFFNFLFFLFSIYFLQKVWEKTFNKKHLFYSFTFSIPIIFHLLSGYIMNNFDQVMINKMVGTTETGLYSFAYRVGMIFQLVITAMNKAWTPLFYQNLRDKNYGGINKTARKYSIIVSGFALFLVIFAPLLVKILASSKFYVALPLVPVIILGFMFQYFYFMYTGYAFYEKKTKSIAVVTIISGLINIGLNYIFIPKFGYIAAAWTTVATFIIFFFLSYLNIKLFVKPISMIPLSSILLPGGITITLIIGVMINMKYSTSILIEIMINLIIIIIYFVSVYLQKTKLK